MKEYTELQIIMKISEVWKDQPEDYDTNALKQMINDKEILSIKPIGNASCPTYSDTR